MNSIGLKEDQHSVPGLVHLYIGEEAVAVGVCVHLTERVTTPNVPIPFSPPLEQAIIPSVKKISNAIKKSG